MSWESLRDIRNEAVAEFRRARDARPQACPNDGQPLLTGPDGQLFCPFDGWIWDGINR